MDRVRHDLRVAFRGFGRSPAFTTTATGWVTMLGATACTGPSLTVNTAASLATLPAGLLTSTE